MSAEFYDMYFKNPAAFADFPAQFPLPPGVTPNYKNPEDRGPVIIIIGGILLGIMMLLAACRVYSKTRIVKRANWDDYTCALAVIGTVVYYGNQVWGIHQGNIGKHQYDRKIPQVLNNEYAIQAFLATNLVPFTLLFAKSTFFLMYLHLFRPMKWLRWSNYVGLAFTVLFHLAFTIAQLVFSTPRPGESFIIHYVYGDITGGVRVAVPQSAIGFGIDLVILVLPIYAIWQLQMPLRRKIGAALVFTIACVASMLSIYYRVLLMRTDDLTWALMPVELAALLELEMGVICACAPSLSHMLRHHLPPYSILKSGFTSRVALLNGKFSHPSQGQTSTLQPESDSQRDDSRPCKVLDDASERKAYGSSDVDLELGQMKSIKTFIDRGTMNGAQHSDHGIRLHYGLEQAVEWKK